MESTREEKEFTSMEEVIRYLETLPVGTYVKGYDCDGYDPDLDDIPEEWDVAWYSSGKHKVPFGSAKEALDAYKSILDKATAEDKSDFHIVLYLWDLEKVVEEVGKEGEAELDGYWLYTADAITTEQKTWDDEDEGKDADFSKWPYWVLTGDDAGPIACASLDEAIEGIINR